LLLDKLPEVLSKEQKLTKIHNLLRNMAKSEIIRNDGGRKYSQWVLAVNKTNKNQ
jgi:hypothetical protein